MKPQQTATKQRVEIVPRRCSICSHAEREAIDKAVIAQESYRGISRKFAVSEDALHRHAKNHLAQHLADARQNYAFDLVKQLKDINRASREVLKDARDSKDHGLMLRAVDRVYRQIELQAKLLGDLAAQPVVSVLLSPQWIEIRAVMLDALGPFPKARKAVVTALGKLKEVQGE